LLKLFYARPLAGPLESQADSTIALNLYGQNKEAFVFFIGILIEPLGSTKSQPADFASFYPMF
tara:strand:- start:611 stop:799 length:189 start_codon:yes stop_codon:yes gene_type:complete